MKLLDAEKLAVDLMNQHGLIEQGWRFKFDRAVRRNGQCNGTKKTISLSSIKVPLNEESVIKNTILHEIAHALVGCRQKHNHIWKQKAKEIGCTGERCSSGYVAPESKYVGTCPNGHTHRAHRLRSKPQSCGLCSRTFDRRFLIIFSLNETFSKNNRIT